MRPAAQVWDLQHRAGEALSCGEGCGHIDCGFVQALCTIAQEHVAVLDAVETTGSDAEWLIAAIDQVIERLPADMLDTVGDLLGDLSNVLRAIDGQER